MNKLNPAAVLKALEAKAVRERLEAELALALRAHKLDAGMVRQFKPFPDVGYAFDFAWPDLPVQVLVEVQGGIWSGGAHARPAGILRDMDKANRANLSGACVLLVSAADIRTGAAVEMIRRAMNLSTQLAEAMNDD